MAPLPPDNEHPQLHTHHHPMADAVMSNLGWDNPEFQKRVISAAVLAPIVLIAIAVGGVFFYTLVLLTAIFMMREWDAMVRHFPPSKTWDRAGVAYVTATCLSFIILREESLGGSLSLLLLLIACVWATDIGAYFAGRQIGGPKLAPRISPNKTWAGLLGGMLTATVISMLLSLAFPFPHTMVQAAWMGALLAVVAQTGDLFESWMKRKADIKDSGTLIPGHGGILDRVDGLTFTAPLLVILHLLLTTPVAQ